MGTEDLVHSCSVSTGPIIQTLEGIKTSMIRSTLLTVDSSGRFHVPVYSTRSFVALLRRSAPLRLTLLPR